MRTIRALIALAFASVGLVSGTACTSSSNAGATQDAGTSDGATLDAADEMAPLDHGMPSTTYPAFKPDLPQLKKKSGASVLAAPVIVTVTWETDPNVAMLESFDDQIGATDYWRTIVSEYGVGVAINGGHVHVPVDATHPLPTTMSNLEIDHFVDQAAGSPATSGWPASTPQTIYVIYVHPDIVVTSDASGARGSGTLACPMFYGELFSSLQGNYKYGFAIPCGGGLDVLTENGGAIVAAISTAAYLGFDDAHVGWTFFQRLLSNNIFGTNACADYRDSSYKEMAPFDFMVMRFWSNAAARGGHDPCVPAIAYPYFGVTPLALETVAADRGDGTIIMTKGINVPVGTTKTFPIGFFSDRATSQPWWLVVAEAFSPGHDSPTESHLTVSVDKKSGWNGEIAYVTVTAKEAGVTLGSQTIAKASYVTILSTLGGLAPTHYMPILITNN